MSFWQKLGLVVLATLFLPLQMFSGGIFTMIGILPVVFVGYYLIRLVRTKKTGVPNVQRRLSVPSQRERPAQIKSYWTINPDEPDRE
jgi:hypothetical protein